MSSDGYDFYLTNSVAAQLSTLSTI